MINCGCPNAFVCCILEQFQVIPELFLSCKKLTFQSGPYLSAIRSPSGDVFVLSPINPLFLFLPALLKMDKFTTLDVLVRSDESPAFQEIFSCTLFDKLCSICDSKVLRLNEQKLIDWLKSGVDRICVAAREITHPSQALQLRALLSASCGDSAVASFYAEAASTLAEGYLNTSALQNLAFQIVADKLPIQLIDKLFSTLGLTNISVAGQRNLQEGSPVVKKPRLSNSDVSGPTEDYSKRTNAYKPVSTRSSAQSKLLKKAQGSKSLTSFFAKK
nr:ribonuclease H2 subunit B [Hymenolepis microstoma]